LVIALLERSDLRSEVNGNEAEAVAFVANDLR
jgi:hypothetical protein